MNSPYIVLNNLSPEQIERWHVQFARDGRDTAEGMWRRSHDDYTAKKFGSDPNDKRRRLVHFIDKYDIVDAIGGKALGIIHSYVYICSTLPRQDVANYWLRHQELAKRHGWKTDRWNDEAFRIINGDYEITGKIYDVHPNDQESGTTFPEDYRTVEVIFRTINETIPKDKRETPWGVWNSKYRHPIERQEPEIVTDLSEIKKYFPLHIELGCGPSLEAGIPPLSRLHHIYSASDYSTRVFLFGEGDTLLERIITNISDFYNDASESYRKCLLAPITPFYEMLGVLRDKGLAVEPLINNNFDGLAKLVGYEELYIRRYETTNWIPDIRFNPKAKGLLVVGSHADRRLVRVHARQAGLKVIYVDPEGYIDRGGNFTPYPLEALDASDILIRMTANDFGSKFLELLKSRRSLEN
jgi:hypothetical protein